jgi:membrane dipeptidase
MRYFDFHCDTLYESLTKNEDFSCPDFHITPKKAEFFSSYIQCFAICTPEEIRGEKATSFFKAAYERLKRQCEKFGIKLVRDFADLKIIAENGGKGAIFTVENSSPLAGEIENVKLFKDAGVRIATLTWNGRNELGAGAEVTHSNGITKFGIEVLREYEKNNIIVDVSHASDRLMYDIFKYTEKPIIATHSNSRAVTNVKRNLTDEQFSVILKRGGVVGLNLHKYFLNDNPQSASRYDILRHAEHFLSLNGENSLCFGADLDGCELSGDISGIENLAEIYEMFLRENYSESIVKKLFFENAYKFCENFDK